MMFDESNFNWKQAIYNLTQDMIEVKVSLTNHLSSHKFWKGVKIKLLVGISCSLVVALSYAIIEMVKK